jgi:hypothetical protein
MTNEKVDTAPVGIGLQLPSPKEVTNEHDS